MRYFKIADRFGDNYSDSVARIMCNVKFLDYPSYVDYEDEVGEKEFWRFQNLDYSPENCWVENNKEEIWSKGFYDLFIDGYLGNSHAESYMNDHMHKVELLFTPNGADDTLNGPDYDIWRRARDYYLDAYGINDEDLIDFRVMITITPDEWTFEGRQAGYYSVMFDVDSDVYAAYKVDDDIETDSCLQLDDFWDDWLDECWESEIGVEYLNHDEAFTKDIDDALREYVNVCGQEVANHIYFDYYYDEGGSNNANE